MFHLFRDSFRYRELIELLTEREIKIRYKQSVLGILWAFFQPAVMVILFTAIFTKVVHMPTGDIPYPLFLLVGLVPWNFFSASISSAIPSIVANSDLVKRIYFPRIIFPLVSILSCAFDFAVISLLLVVLMFYFKSQVTLWILFVPIILVVQLVLTIGISLLFSSLNVFYRDVRNALASMIQIWMFATPVIYPLEVIRPHLRQILLLNPMCGIVDGYRKVLIENSPPNWDYLGISVVISLLIFAAAYKTFKNLEPKFADAV